MISEATSGWVEVEGLRIHYLQAGAQGTPVVLLHGGGLDSAALTYRFTIGPLAKQHRVIAPDWPGFGESAAPTTAWGVDAYVRFLGRLLDALDLSHAGLVGISLGGAIALGLTLRSPERVEKLVLIDSYGLGREVPGGRTGYLLVHLPLLNTLSWASLARSRALVQRSLQAIVARPGALTAELVDEVHRQLQRPGVGKVWRALQRVEVRWPSGAAQELLRPELDRVHDVVEDAAAGPGR